MSDYLIVILAIVAIASICFASFVTLVALLIFFSQKRIKAGWTAKAENKGAKAESDINIEALEQKN